MIIKSRRWFLLMVCVLSQILSVMGQECSYVETKGDCVKTMLCNSAGNTLDIWEDCEVGDTLFTVNDPNVLQASSSCPYISLADDKLSMYLSQGLDAESQTDANVCNLDHLVPPTFVTWINVNEFAPQPKDGSRLTEVSIEENEVVEVASFTYEDADKGETDNLKIEWASDQFKDSFNIEQNKNQFTIYTSKGLDYEMRNFYKLVFNIISTDERGLEKSNTHTIFLSVTDIGDTAPYFYRQKPSASIEEGIAGRVVYQVEAEDGDAEIANEVRYSIIEGNEKDFFRINEHTGEVSLKNDIDHEKDDTFFPLTVKAEEYNESGLAPEPNSAETVTNVNIIDINDEIPTFSKHKYEVEMDEVGDSDIFMNVDIYVSDADSTGDFNRYDVVSDKPEFLEIGPDEPRGNSSITIKVLAKEGTIFDYETATGPITVTLTATEKKNPTPTDTAEVIVTLKDRNDNDPYFLSESYAASVSESEAQGFQVLKVEADDKDKSPDYGKASIRYSVSCPSTLSVDDVTGIVTLARDNALDFEDEQVKKCDVYADNGEGSSTSKSAKATITINVKDVNDMPPSLTLEDKGEILENSLPGTKIPVNIKAIDQDTSPDLVFSIDWDLSTAYKDGNPVSIKDLSKWFTVKLESVNEMTSVGILEIGSVSPDRELADAVSLSIKVTDRNTEVGYVSHESATTQITILDENDSSPQFDESYDDLRVTENSPQGTVFATLHTNDADDNDRVTFSIDDSTYVNVMQIDSGFSANLVVSTGAVIDREKRDTITVTVTVTDANDHETSKQIIISVDDVNDNSPKFDDDVIVASFTENDEIDKILISIMATDVDLGESLQYEVVDDFMWPDGGPLPPPTEPFRITDDTGKASIRLNFDPRGVSSGYCNFTVRCLDNVNHTAEVQAKVYAITSEYQVSVYYNNPKSETQSMLLAIQLAFSDVYKHRCIIDSVVDGTDATKSVVKMHFIDESNNEPVEADVILKMTNEAAVAQELIQRNQDLGLTLESVGNNVLPEDNTSSNRILLMQILLGVVSLVLGSLLLLMLITYFLRTRSLELKLKVATATTFGSVASDLNRVDITGGVPGSNKFAGEGANPMYNLSDADLRNDDSSSIGSGDSVLVGVEDNPEFRGFSSPTQRAPEGHSNPAFSRSIDEVAAPSPFAGGTRTNPLLNADIDDGDGGDGMDLADALQNYNLFIKRQSTSSGISGDSDEVGINPNFSFGEKM